MLRKGCAILEAGAEAASWMCPYAVVSLQKSIGGLAQRSPSPKRNRSKDRWESR